MVEIFVPLCFILLYIVLVYFHVSIIYTVFEKFPYVLVVVIVLGTIRSLKKQHDDKPPYSRIDLFVYATSICSCRNNKTLDIVDIEWPDGVLLGDKDVRARLAKEAEEIIKFDEDKGLWVINAKLKE